MIVALPADVPDTKPVDTSTVAIVVLLLLHVPLVVASLSAVVLPAQIIVLPMIGVIGFTVTDVVAEHPVGII